MRKRLVAIICMLAMLFSVCGMTAFASNSALSSLCAYGDAANENTKIGTQIINGKTYLFLPSNVSPNAVTFGIGSSSAAFTVTGDQNSAVTIRGKGTVDLTSLCSGSDNYKLTFKTSASAGAAETREVTVVCSANVAAMYLVSEDAVNKGREWVDSSADKSNKAKGSMVMQSADGTLVYDGALSQIKGRGNSTWLCVKKPYQIKLDSKTDLLQTGDKSNKAKTWVLLANYNDQSLIRNTIALDLGYEMGMEHSMENRAVDLYYDGEYRGSYLLTEKVQINKGRVDITDLEELNTAANKGTDIESLPVATATTANGATYTYCEGMKSPADYSGGYLLEMEIPSRTAAEVCYFRTSRFNYVVVKSPEFASKEEMDYIATIYQDYEDALYSENGINPNTGKSYSDYVDVESTAKCYIMNELAKNLDGFRTSAYLYKESGVDQLKMGPLWDYDLSFGVGAGVAANANEQVKTDGLYTVRSLFAGRLYTMSDFRVAVKNEYQNSVMPLINNVLLGDINSVGAEGKLHSLAWYRNELLKTACSDFTMWRSSSNPAGDWSAQMTYLTNYITARSKWLNNEISTWNADRYVPVSLYLDVPDSAWYYEYVQDVTKYGLMQGTGMGLFKPGELTTRAQVAKVIFSMSGNNTWPFTKTFSDVAQNDWYATPITWGADNKVILGYADGTFRPNNNITRQELVALLYRHEGSPKVSGTEANKFTDYSAIGSYAVDAMEWAVENGIISGYLDGSVRPHGMTNRAELSKIINLYYEKFVLMS